VKVAYVTSLEVGGPVTHLLDLAPAVAATGADVKVLAASEPLAEAFRARGVDALATPLRSPLDLSGAHRIRALLRGADVVHTHDRRAGLLVRAPAGLGGATVVHTLHGVPDQLSASVVDAGRPLPSSDGAGLADSARLRAEALLSRIGTTVVPSHALARFLAARGFPADRLHVIPNAMTVSRLHPRERGDALVVGTAAVLEARKGVDLLIDACARAGTELRLEVFGDGPRARELEAQAVTARVDARFHGHVDNAASRFGELDLFVLPSWGENFPMAILEAMSWAVPVVATRVGGVPEMVVEGETGLLVEPGDRDALAAAIGRVAADPALAARLGAAGAARIASEFESSAVARRMADLYEELLDRRGGS
jgi:glycosyltransferase involved in cell wall biosynthesis